MNLNPNGNFIRDEIIERLIYLQIDCPECENMEDDQYSCGTCEQTGGNGTISIIKSIKIIQDHETRNNRT